MPNLKQGTIIPTPEEDAEIRNQINEDIEWTDNMFREAKLFEDSDLPCSFKAAVRKGRIKSAKPKILLSVWIKTLRNRVA